MLYDSSDSILLPVYNLLILNCNFISSNNNFLFKIHNKNLYNYNKYRNYILVL